MLPHWAADRRKLIFGRAVVLELSRSAPNLECVLAEFERRDWPSTIGDPFPPDPEAERYSGCETPPTPSTSAARPG